MPDLSPTFRTIGHEDVLSHNGKTARVYRPHNGATVWAYKVTDSLGRVSHAGERKHLSAARCEAANALGVTIAGDTP